MSFSSRVKCLSFYLYKTRIWGLQATFSCMSKMLIMYLPTNVMKNMSAGFFSLEWTETENFHFVIENAFHIVLSFHTTCGALYSRLTLGIRNSWTFPWLVDNRKKNYTSDIILFLCLCGWRNIWLLTLHTNCKIYAFFKNVKPKAELNNTAK